MLKVNIDISQNKVVIGNYRICECLDSSLKFRYAVEQGESKWDFCERLSQFIASYFGLYKIERDSNAVLFIINELIENAVKYSINFFTPLDIEMLYNGENSYLKVTNEVDEATFETFMRYSVQLFNTDLVELYHRKLMQIDAESTSSSIGLILLLRDYQTDLCFEFTNEENLFFVSVCAAL